MDRQKFDSLVSVDEYIKQFVPVLNQHCQEFEEGSIANIGNFVTALEGFAQVIEILLATSDHHSLQVDIQAIENTLREITNALAEGVYSLASDIVKANIVTLLLEWEKEIEFIITTQEPDLLS